MKKLHFVYYFYKDLSYTDKLDRLANEFAPMESFGYVSPDHLKEDVLYIVDAENPEKLKYLVRLDPFDTEATIRQAVIYAQAGKFDNIEESKRKLIYKGGDPERDGLFSGVPLDIPLPNLGLGDLFDKLISALNLSWVPWYAWAGIGGFLLIQAVQSRGFAYKALYGATGAFVSYKAFKKFKSK